MIGGQFIADLTLVISGVTWAIFMIYNKKLIMQFDLGNFSIYDLGACCSLSSQLHPLRFWLDPSLFALSSFAWLGIFWTAIVCWVITLLFVA